MKAPYRPRLPSAGKLLALAAIALLIAFAVMTFFSSPDEPLPTEQNVSVERFMGDWYVQGHVPIFTEKDAYNAVESYVRDDEGKIQTIYAFREGAFDGSIKTNKPTGFVEDEKTGAEWSMRFIWPFKAEYLIAYVDDAYTETIVARSKRDYAWIMTRDAEISDERYDRLAARVEALGYDLSDLRRVPQSWPDPGHPVSQAAQNSLARSTYEE
ncbi:Outer membrane lipoprotein Blc precursor [Planctomycetes bacterium Poly30]|uniref:Outer membrane lipoprotein Blc n=1 Tax=Saltatorellus ferox TaxID=2528018 RepID=A0A518EXH3_9BACT|nr:Outer membrane lipoprotein Blc precursor [Planctomycetes bacterium Poly30]